MSLSKFTPDELVAWVDAELEAARPESYELREGEFTVRSYVELCRAAGQTISREGARDRLNRLVRAGRLTRRREKMNRFSVNVYKRVED